MTEPTTDLCYPVLTPFKFHGVIVKPPAYVQMSADEAPLYQAAGVIGGEDTAALPPEPETDDETDPATGDGTTTEAEAPASAKPAAKTTKAAGKKAAK